MWWAISSLIPIPLDPPPTPQLPLHFPSEHDQFQINGELSPDQFRRAGDKLVQVCHSWCWRSSKSLHCSKYLDERKQYLEMEKVISRKRSNTEIQKNEIIEEGEGEKSEGQFVILRSSNMKEEDEVKEEDIRFYRLCITYDQNYFTPRLYFQATDIEGYPLNFERIDEDIQKEYLDKTITVESFPFFENLRMKSIHPCKHARLLKNLSDLLVEGEKKVDSKFALIIFLKFIANVIPTIQFQHGENFEDLMSL